MRVRIWPSTFKGQLRSKIFLLFESLYYKFLFDIRLQSFMSFTMTFDFQKSSGVQKIYTIRKPIWLLWTTSLYLVPFQRYSTSKLLGFYLDLWPLKIIWGQNNSYRLKVHIWLPIWLLWTTSLYLVPFSRYSTSKFLGFDLDFWPLKIIWVRKKFYCLKAHIWLPIWLLWTTSLYLVPFSRYSTSKFLGFDLDLWPLRVIWSQNNLYRSKAHIWLPIWLLWTTSLYLVPFQRYSTSKFLGFLPWPLTPKGHPGSKQFIPFESPYMTSYLTSMDNISLSRTVFEIFDFKVFTIWPWPLTPKGHLGSKQFIPFESPYMTSYLTSMDTISLSRTVFEIFDFKVFRVWPWPLTPKGQLGSKKCMPFESPYMTSYLTSMDTISLSRTVFEIFDVKVFRVWPWPLTPKGHLGTKNFIPFESPYMTCYLTSMDKISLSRTVFEIFDFKVFRVWPWPLTPRGHLGSKHCIPFESPYMTCYLTSMYNISLSRTVFEIFDVKVFRVWPWPLTPKGHLGSKNSILFESPYMTCYLASMDKISLSRTVFEIFDFKVFRVWPWPLTPRRHLGSKQFIPFESPYMTSYLTSMDNISLSRTVFEIFDVKVFRVWPWPLTPKGHLGSKQFIPFESPYMTSYLTSMYNISLSRTVFEIFDVEVCRVWPWPLTPKGHLGSKNFIPFGSPYMTCYLTSLYNISLSRTVFEIFDVKVFRVWPWPLTPKGHLGSKNFIPFESPYMTCYLTSMNKISLSRTVFEIFDFKVFRVWPWSLIPRRHLGSKQFIPFESPYMTCYLTSMYNISLSRTVFEIFDVKVCRVWPWPLTPKIHLGSKNFMPFESPHMTCYLASMDKIIINHN